MTAETIAEDFRIIINTEYHKKKETSSGISFSRQKSANVPWWLHTAISYLPSFSLAAADREPGTGSTKPRTHHIWAADKTVKIMIYNMKSQIK